MKEKEILPIGSVVLLKDGKKELMIIAYGIKSIGNVNAYDKNGKINIQDKIFDYGGCFYPEGLIASDQIFAFNHEQIDKVSFKGYETEKQKELSKLIKKDLIEVRKNNTTKEKSNKDTK